MKKFVAIILICSFVLSISSVFAIDYSAMSDSELQKIYNNVRNELTSRGLKAEKKTVFFSQKGIQVYINGDIRIEKKYSWDKEYFLFLPIVVVNDSNKNISVVFDDASLNGWTTDANNTTGSVPAGKKAKGEICFELASTDIEAVSDFEDAEFTIIVYDSDDWFGEKIVNKTKPITIYANFDK